MFVLPDIGFSEVVLRKPGVAANSERKGISVLCPHASRNPYSNTYPHHSFGGTCVSGRMHRVEQISCSRWVLYTVKVEWHHFVLCQDSFEISSRSLHQLLLHKVNHNWSDNYLKASAVFLWVIFNFEYKFRCWIGSINDTILRSLFHRVDVFDSKDWQNTVVRVVPYESMGVQWDCFTT